MQLYEGKSLPTASYYSNMTIRQSVTNAGLFESNGLIKLSGKIGKKYYFNATDKGKSLYKFLNNIKELINAECNLKSYEKP